MAAGPSPARQLARPSTETRCKVRDALTAASEYASIDQPTRKELAHALVRIAEAARLLEADAGDEAEATTPAAPSPSAHPASGPSASAPVATAMNAGRQFSGAAVDRMASSTRNVLQAISFPRFVAELINGVFKAMVDTNQQQLQQYLELIRGVSQSLEGFSSLGGSDDAARRWLADRFPSSYAIEGEDEEEDDFPDMDEDEEPEPLRLISVGTPPDEEALRAALSLEADADVPTGGAEALVPFVRRALAQNRQGMLATMIRMGMQRIVIDSGKITAGMRFHIDASSAAQDRQTSAFDARHSMSASGSVGFGWWSASASMSSTIGMVRTSDTTTSEDLTASADLNSSVELNFRTDQVPLDRLASQATQDRLTQNSLNPDRETQLMLQAEEARQERYQARDTARASRQPPSLAPNATLPTPPTAPQLDENIIRQRAGGNSQSSATPSPSPSPEPAPSTTPDSTPASESTPATDSAPASASTPAPDSTSTPTTETPAASNPSDSPAPAPASPS